MKDTTFSPRPVCCHDSRDAPCPSDLHMLRWLTQATRCNVPARRSANRCTTPASCSFRVLIFLGCTIKREKRKARGCLDRVKQSCSASGKRAFVARYDRQGPFRIPPPDPGVQCQSVRKSSPPRPPHRSLPSLSVAKTSRYTKVHSKQMQKRSHMRARLNKIKPAFCLSSGPLTEHRRGPLPCHCHETVYCGTSSRHSSLSAIKKKRKNRYKTVSGQEIRGTEGGWNGNSAFIGIPSSPPPRPAEGSSQSIERRPRRRGKGKGPCLRK